MNNNNNNNNGKQVSENHSDLGLFLPVNSGYDNLSSSDNLDEPETEDTTGQSAGKRKYHRHSPQQILELENFFKKHPHPDDKQRAELSRRLQMDGKQIKFWFQNRRTQMKCQQERHENVNLREENDRLRAENSMMKEAVQHPICTNCGGPAVLGEISFEEHQLRIDNAHLKNELSRVTGLTQSLIGKHAAIFDTSLPLSGSEKVPDMDALGGLNPLGFPGTLHMGPGFGERVSSFLPTIPVLTSRARMFSTGITIDREVVIEIAVNAMEELMKLSQYNTPFWIRESNGEKEILNISEYMKAFPLSSQMKPVSFVNSASKAANSVMSKSLPIVETMMDVTRWGDMFYSLVAKANTVDVICGGIAGTMNGSLQVINAELQALSPFIPIRPVLFIRYCKHHADGLWAIVDVSIDPNQVGMNQTAYRNSKILPSGFVIQEMPNGNSKVVWVEHSVYDKTAVHPVVHSGLAFGAQRWISSLKRHYDSFPAQTSTILGRDQQTDLTLVGRKSLLELNHRMMTSFCSTIPESTVRKWEKLDNENAEGSVCLFKRKNFDDPSEPSGVILSVATSVWLPFTQQHVFAFLCNEEHRIRWDVLSSSGPMQPMFHIQKEQGSQNRITVLRAHAVRPGETNMLVVQEAWTDASSSLIVYAPLDISLMNVAMNGGDTSNIPLLPSGFVIIPYGSTNSDGGANNHGGDLVMENNESCTRDGCLLTVNYQILVNGQTSAKLNKESIKSANDLITGTIQKIKASL